MRVITKVLLATLVSLISSVSMDEFEFVVYNHSFQSFKPTIRRNGSLVFYMGSKTAKANDENVTFKSANGDLQQYLNMSVLDPYALVTISDNMEQFFTYTWNTDGTYVPKSFGTDYEMHPVLQFEHAAPPFIHSNGIELYLFFLDATDKETARLAEILHNITEPVLKFCFDVGSADFNHTLKKYPPSILVRSPLFNTMIELEPPIDLEFIREMIESTTYIMAKNSTL